MLESFFIGYLVVDHIVFGLNFSNNLLGLGGGEVLVGGFWDPLFDFFHLALLNQLPHIRCGDRLIPLFFSLQHVDPDPCLGQIVYHHLIVGIGHMAKRLVANKSVGDP